MKDHKVLLILLLPAISLIMFLLTGNGSGEAAIYWGLFYLFLLFVISLAGLIMLAMQQHRKSGLYLLLGVGILSVVGFGVCSGFMM